MDLPQLRGNLQLSRFELSTKAAGVATRRPESNCRIKGPVKAPLEAQQRVQNAKFTGPSMQIAVTGMAPPCFGKNP